MKLMYYLHGEQLGWYALLTYEAGLESNSWAALIVREFFRQGLDAA